MRAVLDTHAFLWAHLAPSRLSSTARELIEDGANTLHLSTASAWEIAIKHSKGKLDLPLPAADYVVSRMAQQAFEPLPIEITHALRVATLPPHHNDPFDRLLIAQAQVERIPILTSDPNIARYDVETIW